MITLIRREFSVGLPLAETWKFLERIEQWPAWAKHIKHVEMHPSGPLGANSAGLIRLSNGVRSAFTVTEFNPYRNWKWVGGFLWLTVHYDHRFEALDAQHTKLTWIIEGEGLGVSVVGRLFARVYSNNLEKAIPLLTQQMNASAT